MAMPSIFLNVSRPIGLGATEGERAIFEENRRRAGLTLREAEILGYLARGLTASAIGRLLRISDRTVSKHLENAYRKLDCGDRLVAVRRIEVEAVRTAAEQRAVAAEARAAAAEADRDAAIAQARAAWAETERVRADAERMLAEFRA